VPIDHATDHGLILPVVADLARGAGATVKLLHVEPVPANVDSAGRVVAYSDQEMDRMEREWLTSLHALAPVLAGATVEQGMRFGHVVDEIMAEIDAFGADLVVMTTTCRGSVKRRLLGSVAERVMQRAKPPVLLLRPALA
jgi:nucleotide-binding universal stress UspA family protein